MILIVCYSNIIFLIGNNNLYFKYNINYQMKNKSFWICKGVLNTFDQSAKKISQEFVKGKISIRKLTNVFYLITIDLPKVSYTNIFMSNNDQIIGSFLPNDSTVFYITQKGYLRAKYYTILNNQTKFGEFKLFPIQE